MKKKKLLAVGALTLAVLSTTSITSFAASLSPTEKAMSGLYDQIKEKPLNSIVDENGVYTKKAIEKLNNTDKISEDKKELILKAYNDGNVVQYFIDKIISICESKGSEYTNEKFQELKNSETYKNYLNKLSDGEISKSREDNIKDTLNDEFGTVSFGRNSKGETTAIIEDKNNKIIGEINYSEFKEIFNKINGFNSYDDFKAYAKELGVIE